MYTFLTEILGYLIQYTDSFQFFSDYRYDWHNVIIFNIYSIVTFTFFYRIYWDVLKQKKNKNWVKYSGIVGITSYFISIFFQNPLHTNLYYADLIASIVLLIAIALYIKEKRMEENPYPQKYNLMFWTTMGIAAFHIFFPFIFLMGYKAQLLYVKFHLHQFLMLLIVFMYVTFIIGLLFHRRKAFR
ncbi:hypothetical protein [Allomuricauda sp. NBRC 101325]|uniref:hypothetical protein n=1 Tax=Allomuricauda sp. NBRC 101325 TaxID=1113758 RepID=UPI002552A881|nr:hypothetical protein [Muricauda sp. NBRC 101325]